MMAQAFAETHPNEPNYSALFDDDTFGVRKTDARSMAMPFPTWVLHYSPPATQFMGVAKNLPAASSPEIGRAHV